MVEGLTASSRAEKEFEETLRRVNAETRAAQQGARDRADALERGRAAASDAARAEEDLADKLEAGGEALDAANDKLRYRLELLARQSKDQAEIIRLEEDLERKRIAASTMSEEEKATATTASRAREATRLAALEDETREQERRAQEEARALAKKTAEEAEREALRGRGMAPYVLSDKDREQMQQTVKDLRGEGGEETIARRKKLQEQLEADEAARKWLPGIRNADDLNKSIDSNDTTARQAREQEEEARRELERIAAEQAQAERRRGFAGRGSEIDRERDVRAGRRRDLEERERETDERGRGLATNIAAEAGAAAGKVKSDAGKDILQAIKSAFADGVLSDSERSNLTAAIKAVNSSKETEIVGTLREMLSAFESTRNELKAVREQVKSLRDR
jgi:hypothetical protein